MWEKHVRTCFSTGFLLYYINDMGQWTYRSAQHVRITPCPPKGLCHSWNNKAEHKMMQYKCKVWGVVGVVKLGTKDIYLEILLQTRCCFLEWLFFYYSLPTTAGSQEHPWSNICKQQTTMFYTLLLLPWQSYYSKDCSWANCREMLFFSL